MPGTQLHLWHWWAQIAKIFILLALPTITRPITWHLWQWSLNRGYMCNLLHAIIACNLLHAINCTCNHGFRQDSQCSRMSNWVGLMRKPMPCTVHIPQLAQKSSENRRVLLHTLWLVESCHGTSRPRPTPANHRSGQTHLANSIIGIGWQSRDLIQ